jgi:hypothetical protein
MRLRLGSICRLRSPYDQQPFDHHKVILAQSVSFTDIYSPETRLCPRPYLPENRSYCLEDRLFMIEDLLACDSHGLRTLWGTLGLLKRFTYAERLTGRKWRGRG